MPRHVGVKACEQLNGAVEAGPGQSKEDGRGSTGRMEGAFRLGCK